ncbi:MAG: nucleotidyltransferase domain-containing protein [Firmicutes bacterium]|nr:nucleotidyltransferase domain-containing protein [Bacillota bacterium]
MIKQKTEFFLKEKEKLNLLRQRKKEALIKEARAKAEAVAALLKTSFSARKVILFGSLADGAFREGSDIDIFVEGWEGSFWDMYLQAETTAYPFAVNLVCSEDARPSLLAEIKERGVPL